MLTVADIVHYLQQFAPLESAAEWDNVGLLLGDTQAGVTRLMTCLTVTPESAAEAVESNAELIVTHHPIFFRPVQRLTSASSDGASLLSLARAGVAVYSPHTAFDNCAGGINDVIARRLGLIEVSPLRTGQGSRQYKIVAFVPEKDLGKVADAMFAAGAGHIGQYSECSFRLAGIGTFFGSDETNPTVGQKGRREEVSEWRLEAVSSDIDVDAVISAMRRAHSYEEPAYDVYPLRAGRCKTGLGRIGRLPQRRSLGECARLVKVNLHAPLAQMVGDPNRQIERIAIVCGAGGELLRDAVHANADVLVTGELRFHECLHAAAQGLSLLVAGHYASERCGVEELAAHLQTRWPELQVWASRREHDVVGCVV